VGDRKKKKKEKKDENGMKRWMEKNGFEEKE
jgi:hypothetical protein